MEQNNVNKDMQQNPEIRHSVDKKSYPVRQLVLHNDEVNTFEHVIDSLIQVCQHDSIQAEQCAFITHHKGKCDVKNGSFEELSPMRVSLLDRGLQVTID